MSILTDRSESYKGGSNFNALLTPLTFLISYTNSAINPLLYAFLSRNFRKGMRELLLCSFKKGKGQMHQQRIPLHVSNTLFWQNFVNFTCSLYSTIDNTIKYCLHLFVWFDTYNQTHTHTNTIPYMQWICYAHTIINSARTYMIQIQ